jgi:4-aminobutyrate aminotransferase-like enzyme/Ser/Thr protein kinase RdoA (MazF antagonist)
MTVGGSSIREGMRGRPILSVTITLMKIIEDNLRSSLVAKEAEEIASRLYGLHAIAVKLPGEYDDNFHLKTTAGDEFVLKIMHPSRSDGFLNLQCAALQWIERKNSHLAVPRVITTKTGEPFCAVPLDGSRRFVWLLTFIPGKVLAEVRPHSSPLLEAIGVFLGELDRALLDFKHPGAKRELKWDLACASWIREYLEYVPVGRKRDLVEHFLGIYESQVLAALPRLRTSVIYGDANDYNVIVRKIWPTPEVSVIDFGDMHEGLTVAEPAIAAAYAILGKKDDVLAAAIDVVRGYHHANPLQEEEIALLFPLITARLAVSVVNSAYRKRSKSDDPYVTVSEAPAWDALESLSAIHPRLAEYRFREACRLEPVAKSRRIREFLQSRSRTAASLLEAHVHEAPSIAFDLSIGSTFLGADPKSAGTPALSETIRAEIKNAGADFGIGRYDEARGIYNAPQFAKDPNPTSERRTIHLGIDLFVSPGTALYAPLAGEVHLVANNCAPLDYGPLIILKHRTDAGDEFFTLYGHLTTNSVQQLQPGEQIQQGAAFAQVGDVDENGGWPPHVHFQIIVDLLDLGADFPGVAFPSQREVFKSLSPDPNLLLRIPADRFPTKECPREQSLNLRKALIGPSERLSYRNPLKIVRGWMQYLYDETGRAYLDVYNNVPLVGHSHPRVVRAVQEQIALLNTNTRYLHDNILRYAEQLTKLLPEPLRVCYFLNSGSEANELALRIARTHTGHEDIIVLEHAYHGHTTALTGCSPYKFNGPGGGGKPAWVRVAPLADDYRGPYRRDDPDAGKKYAQLLRELLDQRDGVAAFLAESLPSVAGQIVFPPGYLAEVYKHVRAAGGLCIADEVQTGFARLGDHFWGFEAQAVVPDIVVLGKPIGNGFPLAAVITTEEIARSFDNGMEFFSTFGGNPVACAAGLAVLDVLEDEHLQENARKVGGYFIEELRQLQEKYAVVGDVRGMGLFLGIDLVTNRETREPATHQADYIANRLRENGILTGTDGPHHNVLKLRPPLIFSEADADWFTSILDVILHEDPAQP